MIAREAARRILSESSGRKVVVLGDLMLDQFIWGTVDRISPEAPVPVVKVTRESFHLGGAGNVACNIAALGGLPSPVGITGTGSYAGHLRETLSRLKIDATGTIEVVGRTTTLKTRVVAHNQQVVRFDREQDDPLDARTIARLTERALDLCSTADALVVSDYEKGCVTPVVLASVLPAARKRGMPVVVDPKPGHWKAYQPITAITPNQGEAARMVGMRIRSEAELVEAGREIRRALGGPAVLLTRGEKGMLLLEEGREPYSIPAASREVFDVTGAGDTVVAALALCLAGGASLRDASMIANAAAGVVVAKVGTASATADELLAAL